MAPHKGTSTAASAKSVVPRVVSQRKTAGKISNQTLQQQPVITPPAPSSATIQLLKKQVAAVKKRKREQPAVETRSNLLVQSAAAIAAAEVPKIVQVIGATDDSVSEARIVEIFTEVIEKFIKTLDEAHSHKKKGKSRKTKKASRQKPNANFDPPIPTLRSAASYASESPEIDIKDFYPDPSYVMAMADSTNTSSEHPRESSPAAKRIKQDIVSSTSTVNFQQMEGPSTSPNKSPANASITEESMGQDQGQADSEGSDSVINYNHTYPPVTASSNYYQPAASSNANFNSSGNPYTNYPNGYSTYQTTNCSANARFSHDQNYQSDSDVSEIPLPQNTTNYYPYQNVYQFQGQMPSHSQYPIVYPVDQSPDHLNPIPRSKDNDLRGSPGEMYQNYGTNYSMPQEHASALRSKFYEGTPMYSVGFPQLPANTQPKKPKPIRSQHQNTNNSPTTPRWKKYRPKYLAYRNSGTQQKRNNGNKKNKWSGPAGGAPGQSANSFIECPICNRQFKEKTEAREHFTKCVDERGKKSD